MLTFLLFVISAMCTAATYFLVLRDEALRAKMSFVGTYYNYTVVLMVFCVAVGFFISSWFLLILPIVLSAWAAVVWLSVNASLPGSTKE